MKDNLSAGEINYKKRWMADRVIAVTKSHPVVVLSGARQVGKSTLLRRQKPFSSWAYVSFDDIEAIKAAENNPESLWFKSDKLIIDEVQKSPRVLSAIKKTVDTDKNKHFILSGSANLLLMQKVSESLAGRAVYLTLYPMTLGEINDAKKSNWLEKILMGRLPKEQSLDTKYDIAEILIKGQLPKLMHLNNQERLDWLQGYITTYLERDLRQLSQIESLPDFHRAMQATALRSGQLLNQSEISRDISVKLPTLHRYINLLKTTYLLEELPAFTVNRTKRLVKSPKLYWADSALTCYLCGYFDKESLIKSREFGSFFEGLIIHHLRVLAQLITPMPALFYWRTTEGHEVDCVIEYGRKILALEIKMKKNINYSDTKKLRFFIDQYPETVAGIIVYTGNDVVYLDKNIIAVPWQIIAGLS